MRTGRDFRLASLIASLAVVLLLATPVFAQDCPELVGAHDTPGYALGVAVAGSYAYVADGFLGLRVVDVSNPASPFEVGSYVTPPWAWGVAVAGSYAYVADGFAGLEILLSCIFQDDFESGDTSAWSATVP